VAKKFLTPITPPALNSDPSGATAGAIYYNTSDQALKVYDGTTWSVIGSGGGGGSSTATSIQALTEAPNSPTQGTVYFDITEQTIKTYNGNIWYDVAGPKELIDHQHYAGEGFVKHADYGNYVEFNDVVSMDGGTSSSNYSSAPNNDIIDGGNSNGS
jgi:ABC-type dipeptide/oligopeptide/nickel transport system ATPase component